MRLRKLETFADRYLSGEKTQNNYFLDGSHQYNKCLRPSNKIRITRFIKHRSVFTWTLARQFHAISIYDLRHEQRHISLSVERCTRTIKSYNRRENNCRDDDLGHITRKWSVILTHIVHKRTYIFPQNTGRSI